MCISLGLSDRHEEGAADDAIPSLVPPEPLTHMWLIPVVEMWEGLCWTRHGGWVAYAQIEDDGAERTATG